MGGCPYLNSKSQVCLACASSAEAPNSLMCSGVFISLCPYPRVLPELHLPAGCLHVINIPQPARPTACPAQPAQPAHPWTARNRVLGSTCCHPALSLPVPLPVLWAFPPLTDGRIHPSATMVSVLYVTGTLCNCLTGYSVQPGVCSVVSSLPGDKEPRALWPCWVSHSALRCGPGQ